MDYNQFKERILAELDIQAERHNIICRIIPANPQLFMEETLILGYKQPSPKLIQLKALYNDVINQKLDISKKAGLLINSYLTFHDVSDEFRPNNLLCGMMNQALFSELLKTIPYIPYFDMAIIFLKPERMHDDTIAYTMVNDKTLAASGFSVKELLLPALINTFQKFPVCVLCPSDYFIKEYLDSFDNTDGNELVVKLLQYVDKKTNDQVYLITCENYHYGSIAILNYNTLQKIANIWKSNFYILPFDNHAFFVTPQYAPEQDTIMRKMFKDKFSENRTVLTKEILYYDRVTKQITAL